MAVPAGALASLIEILTSAYAATLIAGLSSPRQPIDDPLFSILEILIITVMPMMVSLMVAVHAWAAQENKAFSLLSVVFMSLLAGITCSVHFVILTAGRAAEFSEPAWMPLFLSSKWPSVSYALDILAWDVFFAMAVPFAALILVEIVSPGGFVSC